MTARLGTSTSATRGESFPLELKEMFIGNGLAI
jgi:hypothetical protein